MNRFAPNFKIAAKTEETLESFLPSSKPHAIELFDAQKLKKRAKALLEGFISTEEGGQASYAMKANPRTEVLGAVSEGGINSLDCASVGEIQVANHFVEAGNLLYTHPVRFSWQNRQALVNGVRYFTVQSIEGAQKIWEDAKEVDCTDQLQVAVRVQSQNEAAKIQLSTKFGCSLPEAAHILAWLRKQSSLKVGISTHTGSQNTNPDSFQKSIAKLAEFTKALGGVDSFNIGGGIPVDYHNEGLASFEKYLETIKKSLLAQKRAFFHTRDPHFLCEVGRALVAPSVTLAVPILGIEKRRGERRIFMGDGLFGSFSDATVHNWKYPLKFYRAGTGWLHGQSESSELFGQTCDSGDKLGKVSCPKDLKEEDWIVVRNAGAYMSTQGGQFNGFEKPTFINTNPLEHANYPRRRYEQVDALAAR